ncbi:hypothetical protein MMC32_007753 [Xylographa parallela]|nr:hypothetical protein [Xylographa parallela]
MISKNIPLLVAGVRKTVQLPPLRLMKAAQRTTFQTKAKSVAGSHTQSSSCKYPSDLNPKAAQAHNVPPPQQPDLALIDTSDDGPAFPGWRMSRRQYHEYIANMRWTSNPCGVKADIFTPADWRWIRGESDVNTLEGMAWVTTRRDRRGGGGAATSG